jgi:hypothetical protein
LIFKRRFPVNRVDAEYCLPAAYVTQSGGVPEHRARIFDTGAACERIACAARALLLKREANGADRAAAEEIHCCARSGKCEGAFEIQIYSPEALSAPRTQTAYRATTPECQNG